MRTAGVEKLFVGGATSDFAKRVKKSLGYYLKGAGFNNQFCLTKEKQDEVNKGREERV